MKKTRILGTAALWGIMVILSSCEFFLHLFNPQEAQENQQKCLVHFDIKASSMGGKTIIPTFPVEAIASYRISFSGPGSMEPLVTASSNPTGIELAYGDWEFSAEALNQDGLAIAAGNTTVSIQASSATVTIPISPSMNGTGTVYITIDWPDAKAVSTVEASIIGEATSVAFVISNGKAVWYQNNFPSGAFRKLKYCLKDADGKIVLGPIVEVLHVWDNITTEKTLTYTEEYFQGPRYTIAVSVVGQGTVTLDPAENQYLPGTVVALTPVAADGWIFSNWAFEGSHAENPYSLTVDGNETVQATFAQAPSLASYDLNPSVSTVGVNARFTARYQITNPNAYNVSIRASLRYRESNGHYDEFHIEDNLIEAAPGTAWYPVVAYLPDTPGATSVGGACSVAWYLLTSGYQHITSSNYIQNLLTLDLTAPEPPNNLHSESCNASMIVEWDPSSDPTVVGYNVYRSLERLYNYVKITDTPVTDAGYIDTELSNNTLYYYKVTSVENSGSESRFSDLQFVYPSAVVSSTTLSGTLSQDKVLSKNGDPYIVNSDVTVPAGIVLKIEAGTVVKVAGSDIDFWVNGTLDVQGTSGDPVVFTSYKDDSYGGDTNGDGTATSPAAGNWGQIVLKSSANVLDYCVIRYGGYGYYNSSSDGAVVAYNCSPTISYNTIEYNSSGILLTGAGSGTATVSNNQIRSNGNGIVFLGSGAQAASITNNGILNNGSSGIYFSDVSPAVSGNTISGNGGYALVQVNESFPTYSGNTISGNGKQAISVCGTIEQSGTWVDVEGLSMPYVVNSDLTISSGITLTIPAGTVVKVAGSDIDFWVNGALDVQGTSGDPVVFTSYKDDSYGGDTNGDGTATSPAAGNWGQIVLKSSANVLDYCVIRYGGYGYYNSSSDGAVVAYNCSPTISYNTIEYNSSGILLTGAGSGTATVSNNQIRSNGNGIVFLGSGAQAASITNNGILNNGSSGIYFSDVSPAVSGNTISGNGGYALVQVNESFPTYSGNTISGNGKQAISVCGTIEQSGTWVDVEGLSMPYVVNSDLTISSGITLTIPAGTVVKVAGNDIDLWVNGALDVQGTSGDPVVFTSYKDDSYGGDTNGDGTATSPAAGNWGQIVLKSSANVLDYCVIRYGGYGYYNSSSDGAVVAYNCSPTISYNTIEYNSSGILLTGAGSGTATVSNNQIRSNGYGIVFLGSGAQAASITNNGILNNGSSGIYFSDVSPAVSGNTISGNGGYALVQVNESFPTYSGNTISGNGKQAISVCGTIEQSGTWVDVEGLSMPYVVNSDLTISSGITLTIPAGTVVKVAGNDIDLWVNGALDVQGTSGDPVVFTSYKDDSYGGDTNGDGTATSPAAGNWGQIILKSSANVLDYCVIRYGGYGYYNYGCDGAVVAYNCSPTVSHNTIEYNTVGIRLSGSGANSSTVTYNEVKNSSTWGIYVDNTVTIGSGAFSTNTYSNNPSGNLRLP